MLATDYNLHRERQLLALFSKRLQLPPKRAKCPQPFGRRTSASGYMSLNHYSAVRTYNLTGNKFALCQKQRRFCDIRTRADFAERSFLFKLV